MSHFNVSVLGELRHPIEGVDVFIYRGPVHTQRWSLTHPPNMWDKQPNTPNTDTEIYITEMTPETVPIVGCIKGMSQRFTVTS